MNNRFRRLTAGAAIAGAVLIGVPMVAAAPASAIGGTFCKINISSAKTGFLSGTETTVTGDKCGNTLKVRAAIQCDGSKYPKFYGAVLNKNGKSSVSCNPLQNGNRLVHGYQTLDATNPGEGWVDHWFRG